MNAEASSPAHPAGGAELSVAVLADDPRIRRQASRLLAAGGLEVHAGPADGRHDLLVLLGDAAPDERIAAIRATAADHPGLPLLATMPPTAGRPALRRALRAGCDAIVLDDQLAAALVPSVHAVAAGQIVIPRAMRRQAAPRPLSAREKQILGLVVLGYTNRQIADTLFVAESTVKTHLSSALAKLDAESRSEAAALILDPEQGYGVGILQIAGTAAAEAA